MDLPSYRYTAVDRQGRLLRARLEAQTPEEARRLLRSRGETLLKLRAGRRPGSSLRMPLWGRPKDRELSLFCRQFRSLLRAGVPMLEAQRILAQQLGNRRLRAAVQAVGTALEQGEALAAAMGRHSGVFSPMFVSVVASGEASGRLEEALARMERYFSRADRARSALGRAMLYPLLLLLVMAAVLLVLLTQVLPRFLQVYTELEAEVPGVTRHLADFSTWLGRFWWLPLLLLAALAALVPVLRHSPWGRALLDRLRRLPLLRRFSVSADCAALCRTLGLLLSSGLDLPAALDLSAAALGRGGGALRRAGSLVAQGRRLSDALESGGAFPPLLCHMVAAGEESGDLCGMLERTAEYYDEALDRATAKLLGLLEPLAVLGAAALVLLVILAVFLPMLNMTTAYDRYL